MPLYLRRAECDMPEEPVIERIWKAIEENQESVDIPVTLLSDDTRRKLEEILSSSDISISLLLPGISLISPALSEDIAGYISKHARAETTVSDMEYACRACSGPLDIREPSPSFTERLFELIREKGITETECYRKANIDRKLFSRIRTNRDYNPSRSTAIALALALELDLDETEDLLSRAGYTLSPASRRDLIIEYFITHGNHSVMQINEALYSFGEPLLGSF